MKYIAEFLPIAESNNKDEMSNIDSNTNCHEVRFNKVHDNNSSNLNLIFLTLFNNISNKIDETKQENKNHSHAHSHNHSHLIKHKAKIHHHMHHKQEIQDIKSNAWMAVMGDGLHNFSDGLAIGLSFFFSVVSLFIFLL